MMGNHDMLWLKRKQACHVIHGLPIRYACNDYSLGAFNSMVEIQHLLSQCMLYSTQASVVCIVGSLQQAPDADAD